MGGVTIAASAAATFLIVSLLLATATVTAAPPAGFNAYLHKSVQRKEYGRGARAYWLFEPADPIPASAPVVVLNHGWLAVNPAAYGAWIEHLVRSGHIVIYPRYQADAFTKPSDFLPNALAAATDALDVLETAPGHVRPDRGRFSLIGHSAGGNLAAQMAAVAAEAHLPKPSAVIALMPGEVLPSREPTFDRIPADTLLVVAVAEDDLVVGDARAREIFTQSTAIPLSRKKYILYRSDLHGTPRLIAHHLAPTAVLRDFDSGDGVFRSFQMTRAEINALDHAGFWRLTDITLRAAATGRTLDEATDRGALFAHLGYWSDGRIVTPPIVGDDLTLIPRVFLTNGARLIKLSPDLVFPPIGLVPADPDTTRRR
jgi:acetyl esterase/lipase